MRRLIPSPRAAAFSTRRSLTVAEPMRPDSGSAGVLPGIGGTRPAFGVVSRLTPHATLTREREARAASVGILAHLRHAAGRAQRRRGRRTGRLRLITVPARRAREVVHAAHHVAVRAFANDIYWATRMIPVRADATRFALDARTPGTRRRKPAQLVPRVPPCSHVETASSPPASAPAVPALPASKQGSTAPAHFERGEDPSAEPPQCTAVPASSSALAARVQRRQVAQFTAPVSLQASIVPHKWHAPAQRAGGSCRRHLLTVDSDSYRKK